MPIVKWPTPNFGSARSMQTGQFEANCDCGFVQPLERFQPNIFLMGSITMEKGLKTSEESKTLEMPKRAEELRQSPVLGAEAMAQSKRCPLVSNPVLPES